MKFFLPFLLAFVAICKAEQCYQDKAELCDLNYIEYNWNPSESEEVECFHRETLIDCLKTAVNECGENLTNEEEEDFRNKEKLYEESCSGVATTEAKTCYQEKGEVCFYYYLDYGMNPYISKEETCVHLEYVRDCLKTAASDCEEELTYEQEKGFRMMDEVLEEECSGEGKEENETQKCLKQNADYITHECLNEITTKVMTEITENGELPDVEALKCRMYIDLGTCMVDRTEEKCGNEAKHVIIELYAKAPESMSEGCKTSGIPTPAMFG